MKRIFTILALSLVCALCAIGFAACENKNITTGNYSSREKNNNDNSIENQTDSIKIAGIYEFKGLQTFVLDGLVFTLTYSSYEFFEEGIVNAKYIGATLNGNYVERSGTATYKTVKINDDFYRVDLYVLETQKSTTVYYYGMSINDGDITLTLSGPNTLYELEGTVAMVQYGVQAEYFDGVHDIPFGEIIGEKRQFVYKGGISSSVTVTAKDGFEFIGWSDGEPFLSRYETDVKGNIKVNAIFRQVQDVYKMEYSAEEGGQLEGKTLQYVLSGNHSETVTATPYNAYLFTSWSDGVASATRNDLANNNLSVTANFDYKYTIDYFGIPNEEKRYGVKGATVEPVTAEKIDGYKFVGWSDGVKSATRQDLIDDTLINNNSYDRYSRTITVYAEYEKIKTLSYIVWPANSGYIEGNATQSLSEGNVGTQITAIANQGYRFSHWECHSTPVGENPTRTDTAVNIDLTYYAVFERVCYLNYHAEEGGYINGETEQVVLYAEGHPENVQAVANEGYEFIGWSDGITSPYRYDDRPTADINVTARFKIIQNENTNIDEPQEGINNPSENLSINELTYSFNSSLDACVVSGYKSTISNTVIVPSIYNGIPVVGIDNSAFRYCTQLTNISLPNSIISIGDNAFSGCSSLTIITIPNSVTKIGDLAFCGCTNLKDVIIPNSITKIGNSAFYDCSMLMNIYYKGSESDWENTLIYSSNNPLISAMRYYYSETSPTESGNYWYYDTDGITPVIWVKEN